jgi:hypothetical protein
MQLTYRSEETDGPEDCCLVREATEPLSTKAPRLTVSSPNVTNMCDRQLAERHEHV